jgi:hypothetical protein
MYPDNIYVELFVIILLLICILLAIFYPIYNGSKPRAITALFLTALIVPLGYEEYKIVVTENELTNFARSYTNLDDIEINCDRLSQYMVNVSQRQGEVYFEADGTPDTNARIMYRTCQSIIPLITNPTAISPSLDQVASLHIVSHEMQHLLGFRDEAVAECNALQHNIEFFKMFKILDAEAAAKRYYRELYPNMPMKYTSAECREGGELDLSLPSSVFR